MGDESSFTMLYERHFTYLVRFVTMRLQDAALAQDIAQATFVAVFQHAHTYRPEYPFQTWLTRIATNKMIDHYRTQSRRITTMQFPVFIDREGQEVMPDYADPRPSIEQQLLENERQQRLVHAVTVLPKKLRTVMCMREFGLQYEEIATATGLSLGTVKSRIFRARRLLGRRKHVFINHPISNGTPGAI